MIIYIFYKQDENIKQLYLLSIYYRILFIIKYSLFSWIYHHIIVVIDSTSIKFNQNIFYIF